jgi:glycosyltransferase involved in cell wall biosynthesis
MRIGIDYFAASTHWPGIGRYGRELVRALVRLEDCPELHLWSWGRGASLPATALGLTGTGVRRDAHRSTYRLPARLASALQALTGKGPEALCGSLDVFHRMSPHVPALAHRKEGRPSQVQPLLELPARGTREEAHLRAALLEMDAILCGSQAGARQAIAQLGLPAERVHSVTTGADHWLRDAAPRAADDLMQAGPPRLLVLGAISAAREPLAVLKAFEAFRDYHPSVKAKLVFCGRAGDAAEALLRALSRSPFVESVTWISDPIEADLPALVAGSAALIHLSSGELSPITPLEAMAFGAAIVASDLPAFREVLEGTDGALLVPACAAQDPAELAANIACALDSSADQAARGDRVAQAKAHTWRVNATETVALWRTLTPPRS